MDSDVILSSSSDEGHPEEHIQEPLVIENSKMEDESMEENTLVKERVSEAEKQDKQEEAEVLKKETEVKKMDERVKEKEDLL